MSPTVETIVIALVVTLAVAYVARRAWLTLRAGKSGCGGCGTCPGNATEPLIQLEPTPRKK